MSLEPYAASAHPAPHVPVPAEHAAGRRAASAMLTVLGAGTGATLGVAAASGGHLAIGAIVILTLAGAAGGYAYALCRAWLLGAPFIGSRR